MACLDIWKIGGVEITSNDRRTRSTSSYVIFTDIEHLIEDEERRLEEQKKFHPEEVPSMVLTTTKEINEAFLRNKMNDAVVIMSAHFNDSQRQATKDTWSILGLNVLPEEVSSVVLTKKKETDETYPHMDVSPTFFLPRIIQFLQVPLTDKSFLKHQRGGRCQRAMLTWQKLHLREYVEQDLRIEIWFQDSR